MKKGWTPESSQPLYSNLILPVAAAMMAASVRISFFDHAFL
ncbi:hypothetical protein ACFOWX_03580 [Sphingorhabdus arenilitoris]|uniref:Uncharacterized protein n=1 Tax=Sphingorhabdus arenilitoris TaxID=1490041 RepID=A0ABV8RG84_9SPHN